MRTILAPTAADLRPTRRTAPLWLYVVILFSALALVAPRGGRAQEAERTGGAAAAIAVDVDQSNADAAAIERAFEGVIARVSPGVVGIRARRRCTSELSGVATGGSFEQLVVVNGSGTVIRPDGLILTNEHVVQSASQIDVLFSNGDALPATVFASDSRSDLAILRVARTGLSVVPFCDWSRVARGQWTLTLGNPYGLGSDGKLSVSVGVISNLDRRLPGLGETDDRLYADMIQITAPIVPGNSGGPLFNLRGELVGIVTAMHTRAADDQGIGFAIPMTPARRKIVDRLLAGDDIDYGYIGITARAPTPAELAATELQSDGGVAIDTVDSQGPAARGDLRPGDVITRFDRHLVGSAAQLLEVVSKSRVGETVEVRARRGRERIETTLTIEPRRVDQVNNLRGGAILWRGMRLANAAGDAGVRMGDDTAVGGVIVVDVLADSPAARTSVRVGDVIEEIGDNPVDDINAFRQRVSAEQGAVRVKVRGRGEVRIAAH